MTGSAHKLLEDVLALPEDERLELASEIIASDVRARILKRLGRA
jgi:hypothetical protein